MSSRDQGRYNSSHWGSFIATPTSDGLAVQPNPDDPNPSPLLGNISSSADPSLRIARPAVRTGWLRDGPGPDERRGRDTYTQVEWDELEDLLAAELRRVYDNYGPSGVFGGSYGWSSAGRFHHAQSQVHRFLNSLGGYVRSLNTYSHGASSVLFPHVLGRQEDAVRGLTDWPSILRNTELIVAFGGVPRKNLGVAAGGITRHRVASFLDQLGNNDVDVVNVSPLRDDADDAPHVTWLPLRPGTDVAMMLGLMHTLFTENLADLDFLRRYCVGGEKVRSYCLGEADGVPKSPEWASAYCHVPPGEIRMLARQMARKRTLVTVTWSLQRIKHGEQAPWMGLALAAVLGQIGLPGGGYGHGFGSMGDVGTRGSERRLPTLPQGVNAIDEAIPVARIADMLLEPGADYEYNGAHRTFPDIKLVYWAGGNPFHHHQDLNRLRTAFRCPDTVVVHEPFWTPMTKHADIVVPVTTTLERNDIAAAYSDPFIRPMQQVIAPVGQARNDYDVFAALAHRLGTEEVFTEGRTSEVWIRHLYEAWVDAQPETRWPTFEEWQHGGLELPTPPEDRSFLSDFRQDPDKHPLATPSGRIELFSETISSFDYPDCPGHPVWLEPTEYLGSPRAKQWPLHLIANQPARRLHSQLDAGPYSQAGKIEGREVLRMHPSDASRRALTAGDIVRVFNDRGACLAGLDLSHAVTPGVVQMPTGAWYDPHPNSDVNLCISGNVNVLTADEGTSRLGQGTTGQHVLVEVEGFREALPVIRAYAPPTMEDES